MQRREALAILAGVAVAWPEALRAQQKRVSVVGFLDSGTPNPNGEFSEVFRQGLRETGYVERQNLAIEWRGAEGRYDRLPALAAELVDLKVDALVTVGGGVSAHAAKKATSTIPIVFATGGDPVQTGLVLSFARPGGNLTGASIMAGELDAKRLELLCELIPSARVVALVVNPSQADLSSIRAVQDAAHARGLQLHILKASSESELDAAFSTLAELQASAVIVSPDGFFSNRREQLLSLASRHGIPTIYWLRRFVEGGGLISYGSSITAIFHRLGVYTGQILNGAKPADLPIIQPTKFELVINLKTAKALGLAVPHSLLQRADEVIE
jgi:putative tryptophan/tyrosine transport system substrate-binding protein